MAGGPLQKGPTWGQFIDNIINNIPLKNKANAEVMFTPLAGFNDEPPKAGPKVGTPPDGPERERIGAKLELRRIGWTWVPRLRWPDLMRQIMQITRELND
ncbi:hypothetical protein ENSA7_80180 [Enhygromyxa salina]|uniref:Uncharacterized protein n=1 Tax=Enhygromyxa salina TaxID=215803 RepID=A0A2S9XLI1_9BACT|nr:hypothetical protein ENSA7_80180 [Enhygromyxa salina]